MSTSGYFVLGGGHSPMPLPTFDDPTHSGNLIGSRNRSQYAIDTDLFKGPPVFIPTRNKTVTVWSSEEESAALRHALWALDSELPGSNYTEKLRVMVPSNEAVIVNTSSDTHGSLALVFRSPLYVHGLYDSQLNNSYLVWSTDPDRVHRVLRSMPLRFLLHRFPVPEQTHLFIQGEVLCSKWHRWLKTSQSVLYAFNALEHRLYGSP